MRLSKPFFAAAAALALSGCGWWPLHRHTAPAETAVQPDRPAPAPVHQALARSLAGVVLFDLGQAVPADAVLEVSLADVSRQDVPERVVAKERIAPVGASPVDFQLIYDPADLGQGVDFAVSARLLQGDRLLAVSDERVSVLGHAGEQGPLRLRLKAVP
jgi:putative lipoprotein